MRRSALTERALLGLVVAALGRSHDGAWGRGLHGGAEIIPDEFRDDGCTAWFDSLFGYDFTDLCKVHDWKGCTRTQPPGSMTWHNKLAGDRVLSDEIKRRLPWWLDWTAGLVYRGVYLFGPFAAFDSCGPEVGPLCRHNMKPPSWMCMPPPETPSFLSHGGADL